MLSGILRPTSGTVQVHGRIASLLELGAGFNGELSGRDNVYLNASLLGLTRKETDRLFDEHRRVRRAGELHRQRRQALLLRACTSGWVSPSPCTSTPTFCSSTRSWPSATRRFRASAWIRSRHSRRTAETILFVSHALDLVERICDRSLVLDHGRLLYDGPPPDGSRFLRGRLGTIGDAGAPSESGGTIHVIGAVFTAEPGGPPETEFDPGRPMTLSLLLDAEDNAPPAVDFRVAVIGPYDIPIWSMTGTEVPLFRGRGRVDFAVPALPSVLGTFTVSVGITEPGSGRAVTAKRLDDEFSLRGKQRFGLLEVPYRQPVPVATELSTVAEAAVPADVADSLPAAGA